jgi:hypothetical protein
MAMHLLLEWAFIWSGLVLPSSSQNPEVDSPILCPFLPIPVLNPQIYNKLIGISKLDLSIVCVGNADKRQFGLWQNDVLFLQFGLWQNDVLFLQFGLWQNDVLFLLLTGQ